MVNDVVPSVTEVKGRIEDITSSRITLIDNDKKTKDYYFAKEFDIQLDKKTISQKELIDEFDEYILDTTLTLDGSENIVSAIVTRGEETENTGISISS